MTFNWSILTTLGILAASIHWLAARAHITRSFWGAIWLPSFLDSLLRCPACSGFWIGLGLGAARIRPFATGHAWFDIAVAGIVGMFTTPVFEAVLLWGLDKSKLH